MDELLAMVILGIIEGVTEFLPISSTGHLIVATDLMNRESVGGVTEIVIQLGAVLAVVWFYRADWGGRLLRLLKGPDRDLGWWGRLVVAAIPAAVLGFLLSDWITDVLFDPRVVAVAMIVGGVVLWLVDRYVPAREAEHATTSLDRMTIPQALAVGIAQVVALIPGASVMTATWIVEMSGSASIGRLRAASPPSINSATRSPATTRRNRIDRSISDESILGTSPRA